MGKLIVLRRNLDFPLPVSSAVRCWMHNRAVSDTGNDGPHVPKCFNLKDGAVCRAVDLNVVGSDQYKIIEAAFDLKLGFTGIGIGKDFIHLDDLPCLPGSVRPVDWAY